MSIKIKITNCVLILLKVLSVQKFLLIILMFKLGIIELQIIVGTNYYINLWREHSRKNNKHLIIYKSWCVALISLHVLKINTIDAYLTYYVTA